ncbi:MAG: hypothetical protein FWD68_04275 [Alphaproteobacteria bacterium]|nr:hypothetical protein [Alphaproteobacteria bacterium]
MTVTNCTENIPTLAPGWLSRTAGEVKTRLKAGFGRLLPAPYRPELHYMRGPGPAWRAKYGMDAPFRLKRDL